MDSTVYLVLSWIALAFMGLMLFLALFEPPLPYRLSKRPPMPLDSNQFRRLIAALGSGTFHPRNQIDVLANGEVYYEAELAAIREATHSVNIEAYIFKRGKVTARFLEVLTERARAGVEVNMVVDAVGSFTTWNRYFKDLTAAGGRVLFYHPIRWYTLPRINNRTHRELLIVDGKVGFIETDPKQSIGKRYARMDEAGCPYCFTIDGQTLQDHTVTARDRDTGQQERIALDRVDAYLADRLERA